jgi:hypothetical protein
MGASEYILVQCAVLCSDSVATRCLASIRFFTLLPAIAGQNTFEPLKSTNVRYSLFKRRW